MAMNQSDFENYLRSTEMKWKYRGDELYSENCPYCEESGKSSGPYTHFSFNVQKHVFYCQKCNVKGNIYRFMIDRGDYNPVTRCKQISYKRPSENKEIISNVDKLYEQYQKERGISVSILKLYEVGFLNRDGKQFYVYQYRDNQKALINRKYRAADKSQMWTEKDCEQAYYGIQFLDFGEKILHVCEGEDDAHALTQVGIKNIVSVPFGANNYSQSMDIINAKFETIILIFDNDPAGQEGARVFAEKAGLHKCKNVILPFKDARDCLINKVDIQSEINKATEFKMKEIISVSDVREETKDFIFYSKKSLGRMIRIAGLNYILGGVRLSELTILTGHTGSGKTTWALNFALWCEEVGYPVMILPFENRIQSVVKKLIEINSGDKIANYDDEEKKWVVIKDENWIDEQLTFLDEKNMFLLNKEGSGHNGYFDIEKLVSIIEYAVKYYNVKVFVIDHLHYFLKLSDTRNPVYVIDETIRKIKLLTEKHEIHIVLIVHPHKIEDKDGNLQRIGLNSPKGASSIQQECDNFFVVSRPKIEEGGVQEMKARLDIHKNREAGKTGFIIFDVLDNQNTFIQERKAGESKTTEEFWQDKY